MYSPGTIHHRTAHITCGGKDREWYIYFGQFSIRSLSSDSIFFDQNIDILQKKVGAEVAVVGRCCSRRRLACVFGMHLQKYGNSISKSDSHQPKSATDDMRLSNAVCGLAATCSCRINCECFVRNFLNQRLWQKCEIIVSIFDKSLRAVRAQNVWINTKFKSKWSLWSLGRLLVMCAGKMCAGLCVWKLLSENVNMLYLPTTLTQHICLHKTPTYTIRCNIMYLCIWLLFQGFLLTHTHTKHYTLRALSICKWCLCSELITCGLTFCAKPYWGLILWIFRLDSWFVFVYSTYISFSRFPYNVNIIYIP